MRTKPSNSTTTVERELTAAMRLFRHNCKPGGECCPACYDSFMRRGVVTANVAVEGAPS
jgi:hypothetical protein